MFFLTTLLLAFSTFFPTFTYAAPAAVAAPVPLAGKYQYAATFATHDEFFCKGAQHDRAEPDGVCQHLSGYTMQIWWLAPGCHIRAWSGENCKGSWGDYTELNTCWGIRNQYSYQIFC